MRTLAAWFVRTSQWDFKRLLAEHMWQTAQHADALRTRILELRYPRRDVDRKYDPDVLEFMAEIAKASDTQEFIAGVYDVVLPELIDGYSSYLDRADDLDDAPTAYKLRHIVADKQAQIERAQVVVAQVCQGGVGGLHALGARLLARGNQAENIGRGAELKRYQLAIVPSGRIASSAGITSC